MSEAIATLNRHKLDMNAFYRMGDFGILAPDDRVELIDGEIIDLAPISARHAGTVNWLNRTLVTTCRDRAIVSVQNPVRLDRLNQPLYARFGIPEHWLVNLQERVLDTCRLHDGRYGEAVRPDAGKQLPLAAAPEIVVPLDGLFG